MMDIDNRANFLVIEDARKWVAQNPRRSNPVTADEYVDDVRRLSSNGKKVWKSVLNTTKKNTFFKRRAAVFHVVGTQLELLLKEQNKLQRSLENHRAWVASVSKISGLLKFLNAAPDPALLPNVERRQSKKKNLGLLPEDWREMMIERMPQYREAIAICALTGCRPIEIERFGVQVSLNNGLLTLRICGAKVSQVSGQAWREMSFTTGSLSGNPVANLVAAMAEKENGFLLINIPSAKLFSGAVRSAGKRCFPNFPETITPYSFRHQFSSDLKNAGFGDDVGAALGHSSADTSCRYGEFGLGTGSRAPDAGITTARPVKSKSISKKKGNKVSLHP